MITRAHVVRVAAVTAMLASAGPAPACNVVDAGSFEGVDGLGRAVAVSPNEQWVYSAGFTSDSVAVLERAPAGCGVTFTMRARDGVGGVDGLNGASGIAVSPEVAPHEWYVYATGFLDDSVVAFAVDPVTGALNFAGIQRDGVGGVAGLNGASGVAVSADGANVYVTGSNDDAVVTFRRDAGGTLTWLEQEVDGVGAPPVDGLNGASAVAVSPDGKHVYVTGAVDDAVALFTRESDGKLTYVALWRDGVGGVDGLQGASAVTVSTDGANVYVTGEQDDGVVSFARNQTSGVLAYLGVDHHANGPSGVAVHPDGLHLYAAARIGNTVEVYRRGANGSLVPDTGSVNEVDGARAVAATTDCLYVAVENVPALRLYAAFDPQGTGCSDGNVCTSDDACDGAGACLGAFLPAGTPCAGAFNECTDNTCDGAGTCGTCRTNQPCFAGCEVATCQVVSGMCRCAAAP